MLPTHCIHTIYTHSLAIFVPLNYLQQEPRFYEFDTELLLQNFHINMPTFIFFFWRNSPKQARAASFLRFLDLTE